MKLRKNSWAAEEELSLFARCCWLSENTTLNFKSSLLKKDRG
jgi:hypothetical protein